MTSKRRSKKKIHPTKNATYSQKPEIAKSLSVLYVVLNGCPYTTQHTQRKYQKIFMAVERGGGRKKWKRNISLTYISFCYVLPFLAGFCVRSWPNCAIVSESLPYNTMHARFRTYIPI